MYEDYYQHYMNCENQRVELGSSRSDADLSYFGTMMVYKGE